MNSDCRVIIRVDGRVQGVGYRYAALQKAGSLGLTGFIKNLSDESVYIEAQGSPDDVRAFIAWCKDGTPRAIVESVDYSYLPLKDFTGFQIR